MVLRKLFVLGVVLAAVPALACATREWAHATPLNQDGTSPPPPPPPPASGEVAPPPFIGPTADAICGDNWKWDGIRCRETETVPNDEALASASAGQKKASSGGARTGGPKLLMSDIKPGTGKEA